MKLKIPPAVQFLISALLMYGITKLAGKHFTFEFLSIVSWVFFFAGIIIGSIAILAFKKARTSTDPLKPSKASRLVTSGIYQYTRNPMYMGLLLVLIALFLKFGNYYNITILMLYIWYITTFQIKPEEKALTKIFGDDFTKYCKKVRRWI